MPTSEAQSEGRDPTPAPSAKSLLLLLPVLVPLSRNTDDPCREREKDPCDPRCERCVDDSRSPSAPSSMSDEEDLDDVDRLSPLT
jgi:hypothetical protein